jgi:hypothetical protein
MSTSYPANADSGGTCNITPNHVLNLTFGGAASGQALSGNRLGMPPGAFSRLGVATGITAAYDSSGKHIIGTWSDTIVTNDSLGHLTTSTFPEPSPLIRKTARLSSLIMRIEEWSSLAYLSARGQNSRAYRPCQESFSARHGYKTPAQVRAEQTTPQPAIDQPIDQALSLAA